MSSITTRRRTDAIRFIPDDRRVTAIAPAPYPRRRRRRAVFGETEVAQQAGLDPTRNLAQACSDYYLLSYLRRPHYVAAAGRALDMLVAELTPEFTQYLDLACGGELRHASTWPCELPPCPVLGSDTGRSVAWRDWLAWKTPLYRAEYAVQVFQEASWPSGNYGGEPWAIIALTLLELLNKEMSPELFLDRVWNLQHHGGIVLNKVYETEELAVVLEAHGKDDHNTLVSFASEETRELWTKTFSPQPRSVQEARESLQLWARLSFQPAQS